MNLARTLEARGANEAAREALNQEHSQPLDALALGIERARLELRLGEPGAAREVAAAVLVGCDEVGSLDCAATASYLLARLTARDGAEAALDHLERAVQAGGDAYIRAAGREPDLAPLRAHVRYHEILGFPSE